VRHSDTARAEANVSFGQLNQISQELAELSCNAVHDCTVDIFLQDQQGKVVLKKLVPVNQDTHSIALDVSKVGSGNYHAWMSVGGNTYIRQLKIIRKNEPPRSVKGIIARLFT
jgi:hypothetical protein